MAYKDYDKNLTSEDVAAMLGIDAETVKEWRNDGKMPAQIVTKSGKRWRTSDIRLWNKMGRPDRSEFEDHATVKSIAHLRERAENAAETATELNAKLKKKLGEALQDAS